MDNLNHCINHKTRIVPVSVLISYSCTHVPPNTEITKKKPLQILTH